jgi:hypothetical protein
MPLVEPHAMEGSSSSGIVVLSRRAAALVGWVPIDEFEDLFAETTGAGIAVTRHRSKLSGWPARVRNRMVGDVSVPGTLDKGELLLVVARSPQDLQSIRALGTRRKRFRHVVGFVIDAYFHDGYGSATRLYDHVFTTSAEDAEFVRKTFGVPSSALHQGFDCLNWSSVADARPIDLLGLGRQPASYHRAFQEAFHRRESPVLYMHSPIGSMQGPAVWTERAMLLKLMQRSKIGLAFHMLVEPQGNRPKTATFVTSRWFEQLATGCVVVGKRPQLAQSLFDWPDATLELPDDRTESTRIIAALAADDAFLKVTRRRNVIEMFRRHDWRYRIRDIFRHFDLPLPRRLTSELAQLETRIEQLGTTENATGPMLHAPSSVAARL